MGVNLNDITFPNCVTGIKDSEGEWFKGGYDYQSQRPGGGWARKSIIKQVKHINLGDYNWTIVGQGAESELIPLFTYPNGYTIKAKFSWEIYTEDLTRASIIINWYDKEGNGVGNISNVYQGYFTYSQSYSRGWGILENAIVDLFLITRYYYDVDPAEGSPNHGLEFRGFYGFPSEGYIPVEPGTNYGSGTGSVGDFNIAAWSDLENFSVYLHSHGDPFEGDPFTDEPLPDDPAGSDDTSEPGGGGGNYDDTSDPIDFPNLPTGGAIECGAVIAHRVSKQTLESIMAKLWDTSIFNPSTMWQKSIDDPMNAIVSLHCLPVSPTVGEGLDAIWIGNFETGVSSPKVTSQYVAVDCGSINVTEFWGSALDYSPYTRVEIYLPFIGVKDLSAEDVMRSEVHVKYHVDVLTGDVIAFIKCGLSVLYHFTGNCRMQVPLSSRSTDVWATAIQGVAGIAGATAAVATGGSALLAVGAGISAAGNVMASKIRTSRSGELNGAASLMDDFVPYLIFHRPVQSLAKDYNKFKGYPSNITAVLNTLSGYTEVEHIHLTGIPNATSEEMEEIVSLLKSGVII